MKQIWIFEPSPGWDYCGGMAVTIACSFEQAVENLQKHSECGEKDHFFAKLTDVPGLHKDACLPGCNWVKIPVDGTIPSNASQWHWDDDRGWNKWVLTASFPVDTTEEFTEVNLNYA